MKGLLIIAAFVIALFVILAYIGNSGNSPTASGRGDSQVVLRPAPGNSTVQMFDTISSEQASVMKTFPGGTRCDVVSGPLTAPLAGPPMHFYRLNCNGTTGYINVQWTQ